RDNAAVANLGKSPDEWHRPSGRSPLSRARRVCLSLARGSGLLRAGLSDVVGEVCMGRDDGRTSKGVTGENDANPFRVQSGPVPAPVLVLRSWGSASSWLG